MGKCFDSFYDHKEEANPYYEPAAAALGQHAQVGRFAVLRECLWEALWWEWKVRE